MTSPIAYLRTLFLDYNVIGDMRRLDTSMYRGTSAIELEALRQAAIAGNIEVWMSSITLVEMAIGLENKDPSSEILVTAKQSDVAKRAISDLMNIRWLTYPASKTNDTYSRTNLTLRTVGPDWQKANALETKLLQLSGVSPGDARQVVSCVYGQAKTDGRQAAIWAFVSEDGKLRRALTNAQADISELKEFQVFSVKAFMNCLNLRI